MSRHRSPNRRAESCDQRDSGGSRAALRDAAPVCLLWPIFPPLVHARLARALRAGALIAASHRHQRVASTRYQPRRLDAPPRRGNVRLIVVTFVLMIFRLVVPLIHLGGNDAAV